MRIEPKPMTAPDFVSYFLALVAISLAPGPVALMLMVRSASNDMRGAMAFRIGFALGGILIISAVCFGLSAWLTAVPEVFEYSKYVFVISRVVAKVSTIIVS
jgi:threonine/homoserine/homoserine lactone efflux protein